MKKRFKSFVCCIGILTSFALSLLSFSMSVKAEEADYSDLQVLIDYAETYYEIWEIQILYCFVDSPESKASASYYAVYGYEAGSGMALRKYVLKDYDNTLVGRLPTPDTQYVTIQSTSLLTSSQWERYGKAGYEFDSIFGFTYFNALGFKPVNSSEYPNYLVGKFPVEAAYSVAGRVWLTKGKHYVMSFFSTNPLNPYSTSMRVYNSSNSLVTSISIKSRDVLPNLQYLVIYDFVWEGSSDFYSFSWHDDSYSYVYPLFWGEEKYMTDRIRNMCGYPSSSGAISDLIQDGNSATQAVVNSGNQINSAFNSTVGDYDQVESGFVSDFESKFNQIDLADYSFQNLGNDFVLSANFVKTNFERLTNNQFGILLGFSLILGLALLMVGRRL